MKNTIIYNSLLLTHYCFKTTDSNNNVFKLYLLRIKNDFFKNA